MRGCQNVYKGHNVNQTLRPFRIDYSSQIVLYGMVLSSFPFKAGSAAFEMLQDQYPLIQKHAAPRAIIRWAAVDGISGDETTIEGVTFHSRVVADKLRDTPRVFLSVVTAGRGLEEIGEFEDEPFLNTYNGALLFRASRYVVRYMKDKPEGHKWIILACLYLTFVEHLPMHPQHAAGWIEKDGRYYCPHMVPDSITCRYCMCEKL